MTQTTTTRAAVEVSKNEKVTAAFMAAIQAMSNAQDKVLEALTEMYGDDTANDMFNKLPFTDIEKQLGHYMYINFAEALHSSNNNR